MPGLIFDDCFILLPLFQVAKPCPRRFSTNVSHFCNFISLQKRARVDFYRLFHTFATFSHCKTVPGSIVDDSSILLQLFQVAKPCPGGILTNASHFWPSTEFFTLLTIRPLILTSVSHWSILEPLAAPAASCSLLEPPGAF